MRLVYHCYGGTHSSLVAGAIHVGMLPVNRLPTEKELLRLPYFDKLGRQDAGRLLFLGSDSSGNRVYCLGRRRDMNMMDALVNFAEALGIPKGSWKFINVMPLVNLKMKVGGLASRRLGIEPLGRKMVLAGTLAAYPAIRDLAWETRVRYARGGSTTTDPDGTCPTRNGCEASAGCVFYCSRSGFALALAMAQVAAGRIPPSSFLERYAEAALRERRSPGAAEFQGTDADGRKVYAVAVSKKSPLSLQGISTWLVSERCPRGEIVPVEKVLGPYALPVVRACLWKDGHWPGAGTFRKAVESALGRALLR